MSITRRVFLRNSALAVVGTTALPAFLHRAAFGAENSQEQAPGRNLPARRRRRAEHRGAPRRAALLRDAAHHQHSAQVGPRPGRLFRAAPSLSAFQPLWSSGIWRSCMPQDRPTHALALRCAGFHGIRHARHEGHRDGWLNRALHDLRPAEESAFRAIALGPSLPRILTAPNRQSP